MSHVRLLPAERSSGCCRQSKLFHVSWNKHSCKSKCNPGNGFPITQVTNCTNCFHVMSCHVPFLQKKIILLCFSSCVQSITWPYFFRHSSHWRELMPETQSTLGNKEKTHTSVCVITKGIEAIHIDVNINIQKTKKKTKKKIRNNYKKGSSWCRKHMYVFNWCKLMLRSTAPSRHSVYRGIF